MDEARRLAYLNAMGVKVWTPRHADAPAIGAMTQLEWVAPVEPVPAPVETPPPSAPTVAADAGVAALNGAPDPASMDWEGLADAVAACRACALCDTRTQTVFGVGNREARLMIIGEAPGAEEDREGKPFVGRAGQLLNRMLAAIGFARDEVYIANVLKCRPPGNRDPRPEESLQCQGFLLRQVALIRPGVILAVGRISAQQLLRTDESVGRLRGRWFEFGEAATPLRVTYHPAYLLRSPEQKVKAWDDLTAVWRRLKSA